MNVLEMFEKGMVKVQTSSDFTSNMKNGKKHLKCEKQETHAAHDSQIFTSFKNQLIVYSLDF